MALFLFFTAHSCASRNDLLRRMGYNAGKKMIVRFISDNHNTAERMSATRDDVDNKGVGMEWGGTHHQFWMSLSGSGLYRACIGNGWAGRRLGLGEQSPLLCYAPPTQPGYCIRYPERLREVAPKPGAGVWTRGIEFHPFLIV